MLKKDKQYIEGIKKAISWYLSQEQYSDAEKSRFFEEGMLIIYNCGK